MRTTELGLLITLNNLREQGYGLVELALLKIGMAQIHLRDQGSDRIRTACQHSLTGRDPYAPLAAQCMNHADEYFSQMQQASVLVRFTK